VIEAIATSSLGPRRSSRRMLTVCITSSAGVPRVARSNAMKTVVSRTVPMGPRVPALCP
jgi:hypothetical protein